ncbi:MULTISPECIES: peptidoglycan-binding domain-containing protein [unclassified Streptomyces]|uniref:peptidoglycan-binding domain-containing protein n=1 Tax=unclassified Streptomyces TaxID=2593676 RepID=UPI0033A72FE0
MIRKRIVSLMVAGLAAVGVAGALPLATAAPAQAAIISGRCEFTSSEPQLSYAPNTYKIAVKQAQCELNWAMTGDNLTVDGYFGSDTRAAVVRFQRCVGIDDDGIIGPVTWGRLNYWARSSSYAC